MVDTDACDAQVGFEDLQEQPQGRARPKGYLYRSITMDKKLFDTNELEVLAVFWAVNMLYPYLKGKRYVIHHYHRPQGPPLYLIYDQRKV